MTLSARSIDHARQLHALPRVLVVVSGGLVSAVLSDRPVKVCVKDFDEIENGGDFRGAFDTVKPSPTFDRDIMLDVGERFDGLS